MSSRVRARHKQTVEEIDKLHAQLYPQQPEEGDEQSTKPAENSEAKQAEPTQEGQEPQEGTPQTTVTPAEPPKELTLEEKLQQKYDTLEGKYRTEVGTLNARLKDTEQMLAAATTRPEMDQLQALVEGGEITQEELDEYGPELVGLMRKAAREQLAPLVEHLKKQNEETYSRLEETAKASRETMRNTMIATLDQRVPDWQKLNEDPAFVAWIRQPDVLSGQLRQTLLQQAFDDNDTNRVIAFFEGYKTSGQTGQPAAAPAASTAQPATAIDQQGSGLETLVAPGRPAGTQATGAQQSGKIWTRAEIEHFSKLRHQNRLTPEQISALDTELHKAAMEGRIQG